MLSARIGLNRLASARAQRPANSGTQGLRRLDSCATLASPSRLSSFCTPKSASLLSQYTVKSSQTLQHRSKLALQSRNYSSFAHIYYRPQTTLQDPYNEKIKSLIEQKQYQEALSVFEEMTSNSVLPDGHTFVNLALAMAHLNPKSSAEYLMKISDQYATVTKTPEPPVHVGKSILSRLAKKMKTTVVAPRATPAPVPISSHDAVRESAMVFEEPEEHASLSFMELHNAEMSPIFKVWVDQKAPEVLIDFLLHHHVKPRYTDVCLALEQCVKYQKAEEGWQVYQRWKTECSGPLIFHLAVVLCAEQIGANGMLNPNLSEKEILSRIQTINDDMAEANQLPTYQTQAYLLRHWSYIGRQKFANNLFQHMLSDSYISSHMRMSDYNVMLNLHANNQQVEAAEALFESLRTHPTLKLDATIYTTMVKVYARAGDPAKAWSIVGEMVRHGTDPALYARARGLRRQENDVWPTHVTMSILLDMESRENGPVALIETFEAIRNTYHLTPSLNNYGALLEQLIHHHQFISFFDWFVSMMRTQSLKVTLRECCYLTLLDPNWAPLTEEEKASIIGLRWNRQNRTTLPELTADERRKWIATVYRWKDLYIRNNILKPPPELDMAALAKIRGQLLDDQKNLSSEERARNHE